ncbi:MAG: tRNA (adenosine(37)-N6)-dimethylallyltransferase MiaA, partial [Planctomycetota bacterium]
GQPLSHQQVQFDEVPTPSASRVFVLTWPRELLLRRIDERVDQMFADGLIDEVRGLVAQHGSLSRTALQAVGYREVIDFLQGTLREAEMIERVKVRTHQFSKRQETWFRGLAECRRVLLSEPFEAVRVAAEILAESQ